MSTTPAHESPLLPPFESRRRIAEAIHGAVCRATDSSGLGLCAVYAAVAVAVLGRLTGARYVLQAGMISIRLSAAHLAAHPFGCTHFTMDGRPRRPGGRSRALDLLPEFHAWAGRVHRISALATAEDFARQSELVDLSARHYRTNIRAIDPAWPGQGDFDGDFLWTTGDQLPDGLVLVPDMATTLAVASRLDEEPLRATVRSAAREALEELRAPSLVGEASKVGRNEACPCGSGRKFKKCCGGVALKAA